MFGIGDNHKNTLYSILIDIGSGSVGVAVVESSRDKKLPHVIFSHRVFMRVTKTGTGKNELLRQIREALLSACLILSKDGMDALNHKRPHALIKHIFLTCSAPWGHTISRNVRFESETPFKVTESFINDLEDGVESEVEKYLSESTKVNSLDYEIVERSTVDVLINDYQVNNPVGLSGTEISLSHIIGLVPNEILKSVYEIRDKLFTKTDIRAHTAMLVTYCVMRDIFPHNDELTIVKVTGEATEFGVVKNGLLIDTIFAPYGSNTLIREIMERTNCTTGEAKTMLQAYAETNLTTESHETIFKYLNSYKESLTKKISEFVADEHLPPTMLIIADSSLENLFKGIIPQVVTEVTRDSYSVLTIDPVIISEIVDNNIDLPLVIAIRFFHKLHGCGDIKNPLTLYT